MPRSKELNIERNIFDVVGKTRAPKLESETGWWLIGEDEEYEIPFENGWGNFDDEEEAPVAFHHSGGVMDDEVRCRGVIDGGSEGDVVFVFPIESRPETRQRFTCSIVGGGYANVTVDPNGEVIVQDIN